MSTTPLPLAARNTLRGFVPGQSRSSDGGGRREQPARSRVQKSATRGRRSPAVLAFVVATVAALAALPAAATHVDPVLEPGNPSCGAGFLSLKIDPPASGTFALVGGSITVTIAANPQSVSWSSTIPIDRFIVKAGPNANVYYYDPPETSDTGLVAPIGPNGEQYGFSHFEICYRPRLAVTKTAVPAYTRTFTWDIQKSANPTSLTMFNGDSGNVDYVISLQKTVVDSGFGVTGEIQIQNPSTATATIVSVTDVLSDGTVAAVNCPGNEIPAGESMTCTYAATLDDAETLTNTATVTTTGPVGGGTATAPVVFGDPTTVVGTPTATVVDSVTGNQGTFGTSSVVGYSRTFSCGSDQGTHPNTATIVETGQSSSASVTVACHVLQVTKSASTRFERDWTWQIAKASAIPNAVLSPGQVLSVGYQVQVQATFSDSDFGAFGTINVFNPAPIPATLNGVSDLLSDGTVGTVDCGVTFPWVLAAGENLPCSWTADLPDADTVINTATATMQNTPAGTTSYSGQAVVDFSGATVNELDECIALADTFPDVALPAEACAAGGFSQTFEYQFDIGPFDCGEAEVTNTASFTGLDTGATGSDDAVVLVEVPCPDSCTLTPGYWKTHSAYGPAPYDDTWAQVGEDTPFFLSGQSWYQALWTAPSGNAYYILAHAWIATYLNILNGSPLTADVQDAFEAAQAILETYTPAEIAALKGKSGNELRAQIIGYAWILDEYNNGLAVGGPPHCSE